MQLRRQNEYERLKPIVGDWEEQTADPPSNWGRWGDNVECGTFSQRPAVLTAVDDNHE